MDEEEEDVSHASSSSSNLAFPILSGVDLERVAQVRSIPSPRLASLRGSEMS